MVGIFILIFIAIGVSAFIGVFVTARALWRFYSVRKFDRIDDELSMNGAGKVDTNDKDSINTASVDAMEKAEIDDKDNNVDTGSIDTMETVKNDTVNIKTLIKDKVDMDKLMTTTTNFTQSLAFKGIAIATLTVLLLIPGEMIRGLIGERKARSRETIESINSKWSVSQTLCAPVMLIPYTTTISRDSGKTVRSENILYVTPNELDINVSLTPETRYYGIYKAILYKSDIHFKGNFSNLADLKIENGELHFDRARIAISITDLKGVTRNPELVIDGKPLMTSVDAVRLLDKVMTADLKSLNLTADSLPRSLAFDGKMNLNGSSSFNFIPVGQTNTVTITGQWRSPSFEGNFSPESEIDSKQFRAVWNILGFNRDIPEKWSGSVGSSFNFLRENSSGVSLIETVNHYQQSDRSAKYALMFIALTFIVFFFVEVFTKKPIHVFQYVLVGIALILFYSLLLSLSEHIGFGWAYLTASGATIALITLYFYSLIRQAAATSILAGIMVTLYAFLYVILQTEDYALLFGSVFLFVILGVIMFVSNKIKIVKAVSG